MLPRRRSPEQPQSFPKNAYGLGLAACGLGFRVHFLCLKDSCFTCLSPHGDPIRKKKNENSQTRFRVPDLGLFTYPGGLEGCCLHGSSLGFQGFCACGDL